MTNYFLRIKQGYQDVVCVKNDEVFFIPMDEGNVDYQAYLAWVTDGNESTEWTGN
jgi:hypothetical protein